MKKQGLFRTKSPGKINPFLRVVGRGADGYHQVHLALVAVTLFDTMTFRPLLGGDAAGRSAKDGTAARDGIVLTASSPWPLGAAAGNLIVRAAQAFHESSGKGAGWAIHLRKAIPPGAGLGGGSANAAGTLMALNTLHGRPLSHARLREVAAGLGADVPFFLQARPAIGRGRGEQLTPLPDFPRLPVLILHPPFSISTAEAYRTLRPPFAPAPPLPKMRNLAEVVAALHNDFEPGVFRRHPELREAKAALLTGGAAGALLAGSGSALFAIYPTKAARDRAARAWRGRPGWRAYRCETMASHAYLP